MTYERDGDAMTIACSGCGAKRSETLTGSVSLLFVGWWECRHFLQGEGPSEYYCPKCWHDGCGDARKAIPAGESIRSASGTTPGTFTPVKLNLGLWIESWRLPPGEYVAKVTHPEPSCITVEMVKQWSESDAVSLLCDEVDGLMEQLEELKAK